MSCPSIRGCCGCDLHVDGGHAGGEVKLELDGDGVVGFEDLVHGLLPCADFGFGFGESGDDDEGVLEGGDGGAVVDGALDDELALDVAAGGVLEGKVLGGVAGFPLAEVLDAASCLLGLVGTVNAFRGRGSGGCVFAAAEEGENEGDGEDGGGYGGFGQAHGCRF